MAGLYFIRVRRDSCRVNMIGTWARSSVLAVLAAAVLGGCATSTVESRKKERYASYAALTPELRTSVDTGQLKIGMTTDAVYIAWGKPSQILVGQSTAGTTETWIYAGSYMEEHRYWSYRRGYYGRRFYGGPTLEYEYAPRAYTRAEVVFENGVVKSWRTTGTP